MDTDRAGDKRPGVIGDGRGAVAADGDASGTVNGAAVKNRRRLHIQSVSRAGHGRAGVHLNRKARLRSGAVSIAGVLIEVVPEQTTVVPGGGLPPLAAGVQAAKAGVTTSVAKPLTQIRNKAATGAA